MIQALPPSHNDSKQQKKNLGDSVYSWSIKICIIAAILFAAMYLFTALPRLVYPYDLDFDEDSILMESLRIAQGQAVYIPPSATFDPHVYMPLFFWLGSALLKITGPNLIPLRLISLAATLTTTLLIYWIAQRESRRASSAAGRRWVGLACAGLYLGGYRINGFWYEVVRVDSLFVMLMVGGLALGIFAGQSPAAGKSPKRLVLSAVVMALAFFTKQPGALVGAVLALYLFAKIGWRALWFALPFAALALFPLFALNASTDGWFFYHVFRIGSADPIELGRIVNYVAFDVFGVMAGLSIMAVAAALLAIRQEGWRILRDEPWLLAIGVAVLISGLGRARVGGNLNDRMPAYALLCLAPALLVKLWNTVPNAHVKISSLHFSAEALVALAILLQFALGVYNPLRYIPTEAMRISGDRLIARIASVQGNVLVMMHPYYALLAGKEPSAQSATLWYVRERGALPLPDDFVSRLQTRYYAMIISDESVFETEADIQTLITSNYVKAGTLDANDAPPTMVGVVVRPMTIYLPKDP